MAETREFLRGPTPPWRRWDRHYAWGFAHFWAAVYGPLERRRYHLRSFSLYAQTLGLPASWAYSGP